MRSSFRQLDDPAFVCTELHTAVQNAGTSISPKLKRDLLDATFETDEKIIQFLTDIIFLALRRPFQEDSENLNNLLGKSGVSRGIKKEISGANPHKPCKHFVGRENEIEQIHQILETETTLFLYGVGGIGKSELAKRYAQRYHQNYINQLFIPYTGNLEKDIANLNFEDDELYTTESVKEKFQRHNHILQQLKSDSLLIIDNFNTVEEQEPHMQTVMDYSCHVLFTTQSNFEDVTKLEVKPLSKNYLLKLVKKFYHYKTIDRPKISGIIEEVYQNTFVVELCSRLLGRGTLCPRELLDKLRETPLLKGYPETIFIRKDQKRRTAMCYDHIALLFSLFNLSVIQKLVLRSMTFMPLSGITIRQCIQLLALPCENEIRELIETGLIHGIGEPASSISMHPLIRDVVRQNDELKPTVRSCHTFLEQLSNQAHFRCNEQLPRQLITFAAESVVDTIENDDSNTYISFLENVHFRFVYHCMLSEAQKVHEKMSNVINSSPDSDVENIAIYLYCAADFIRTSEQDRFLHSKEIQLLEEALEYCPGTTQESFSTKAKIFELLFDCYTEKATKLFESGREDSDTIEKALNAAAKAQFLAHQYGFKWGIVFSLNEISLLFVQQRYTEAYDLAIKVKEKADKEFAAKQNLGTGFSAVQRRCHA